MTESWKQWEGQTVVNRDDESISFQLTHHLGGSPSGPVFLTELGPEVGKVAIKLHRSDPATNDAQRARWRRIAQLSHPNLLRLLHTGICRLGSTEMLFAVMEYAEEDLSQILPERALTASETLDMLKPALEALGYLHSQGFVHGHLKPANIMAVKDQLKLASDGVSVAGDPVSGPERGPYDPPEMHDGSKAAGILPCSDAWSLGITLAEVLTQQRPSWQKEGQQDPALPKEIPGPFLDIIRNCLRSEPQQRWTIEQIAARLHPPSPAPAKAAPARQEIAAPTKKTPSRRWRYIVPSAAVAFAAVLVAGLGILNRQQPTPIQPQTQMREDPPIATTLPTADAEGAQKPSPATSLAGRNDSQQAPKAVEAPLPASPATGETRTTNGDTKTNGIVQQVLPDVPQKARDTIQGKVKVKVRVQVDASGDVTEAELDSPGPSKYFAQLALQAAQRWKFEPAQAGTDSSREWLLRFEFGSVEAKAFPSPAPRKVQ